MLFEEAVNLYWADKSGRLRGNTLEGYASAIRRHLLPQWAGRELESIAHEELQEWVDSFDLPGAAEKAYKTFRQICGKVGFWGSVRRVTFGKFNLEGKDAIQLTCELTEGYSVYLIADATGLSFISDETGSNVNIGKVSWG